MVFNDWPPLTEIKHTKIYSSHHFGNGMLCRLQNLLHKMFQITSPQNFCISKIFRCTVHTITVAIGSVIIGR